MSPSPNPRAQTFSGSEPYTKTDSVDTSSFGSLFSEKSSDSMPTSTPATQPAWLSSILTATGPPTGPPNPATNTASSSSSSSTAADATATSGSSQATTGASSASATSFATSTTSGTSSAVSNSANANELHQESSTMSSPGMQAAVAVPVVVVVLAIIALIFFCMRRRRKTNDQPEDVVEKQSPAAAAARKKKWTRHLRVFSFDTELLMGGRYSSTNSIRSRQTGSLRSATRSQHSAAESVHSVEEVAPPYRDAIHQTHPSISQVMTGAAVARSPSTATAPPPYGSAAGRLATPTSPATPGSQRSNRNPFADSPPISPVEGSPFNDPPGTTPVISRNSSLYRTDRDDTSTIGGASDAASIREATLARNASVMSGGRVIQNIRENSQ